MIILQIEHKVRDYDNWKKVFDSDPIGRERSGVKRYRIYRPADDPNHVVIDLEFDDLNKAKAVLAALQALFPKVEGTVITDHKTRILNVVEAKEY